MWEQFAHSAKRMPKNVKVRCGVMCLGLGRCWLLHARLSEQHILRTCTRPGLCCGAWPLLAVLSSPSSSQHYPPIPPPLPPQMWVLDALPGPDPLGAGGGGACSPPAGSADPAARPEALMAALRTAPLPTTHRRFVTAHLERAGFPPHVAAWAAQNLAPDGRGRLCWGFDLDGIEQMYRWVLLPIACQALCCSYEHPKQS